MRRVPLVLVVAAAVAVAGLVAGSALLYGAERGDRPDRGGPAAGGSGGGPPMPPMKGMPDGGRDRDPVRPAPMWRPVTDEDVAQIMTFVAENMPWMKADLEKQKEADPARFRMVCLHLRFDIEQLKALEAADPKAFKNAIEERKLRADAHDLAIKFHAATDPKERDTLKEQLRTVLGQLFDKEMAVRTAQIAQVEKRLEVLRKELKDRVAARSDVVANRLDDMLKGRPEGPGDRPAPPSDKAPAPTPDKSPPPPAAKS